MPLDPRKPDDDGTVICKMNVEGMPWHIKGSRSDHLAAQSASRDGQLTRSEARRYTWYSILAGLSIVAVFALTWVLLILFCIEVWFR